MTVYSYLRISSLHQDEENQRQGVIKKAQELGLKIDKYVIDKKSGAYDPKERNLGKLLRKLKKDDVLIVSEISRLGRKLFMIMKIISYLIDRGVILHSVKENFTIGDNIQSKVLIFAFGLAAEIERNLISSRTKEALAYKKAQGVHLGRKFGAKINFHKLNDHKKIIMREFNSGWSKSKIARKYKVCHKTIRKYLRIYQAELAVH
jgi:DNA invertase Pin-like site-specific DNA recombinase